MDDNQSGNSPRKPSQPPEGNPLIRGQRVPSPPPLPQITTPPTPPPQQTPSTPQQSPSAPQKDSDK